MPGGGACQRGRSVSAGPVRVSGGRRGYPLLDPVADQRCATVTVPSFQNLPLADREREWDGAAAEKRVREWAGAQDEPNAGYRDAHAWYDAEKKQNFTAYKLLIADVVDGRLVAVPRGVMAAAAVMQGSRGGVDLPEGDIQRVKHHLARYYAKMGETAPWDEA
jgi:hypothetical protein